mmetsp:Transcript_14887/g.56441  ORF Transcript_14887/g.56441 Transcript_14887/m.56441 type:complete len:205 (+) Transcript_14887:1081-1695(+)|eukprot:scaffold1220_cov259-Pinguiococcus_pyrenoidosus.AAC.93
MHLLQRTGVGNLPPFASSGRPQVRGQAAASSERHGKHGVLHEVVDLDVPDLQLELPVCRKRPCVHVAHMEPQNFSPALDSALALLGGRNETHRDAWDAERHARVHLPTSASLRRIRSSPASVVWTPPFQKLLVPVPAEETVHRRRDLSRHPCASSAAFRACRRPQMKDLGVGLHDDPRVHAEDRLFAGKGAAEIDQMLLSDDLE